ncbi:MAG: GDSL-type esterase/lipase family protein [Oscillospiraceae bacterium]|nr:GDSL-type esterase/lipase family protein [Oscillospiraceae bacterium]
MVHNNLTDRLFGSYYNRKCRSFANASQQVVTGQLVLCGDSLTELWAIAGEKHYPQVGLKVYNRGISADTCIGLIRRLDVSALVLRPKILVLLIGINDFWRANWTAGETLESQRIIIERLQREIPDCRIIVESLYPIHQKCRNPAEPFNGKVRAVNQELRKMVEKLGCEYLDIHPLLADEHGNMRRELSPDGLHINGRGYEIVRKAIEAMIGTVVY